MKKLILGLLLVAGWSFACSSSEPKKTDFKVVVLGFDGVDPDLVNDWIDHLPTLKALRDRGTFTELGSTKPPESPVAWASFATGQNPGKHGIFDFLKRDPKTYYPDIGLVEREKPKFILNSIPVKAAKITNNRKGTPFWKHLDESGIVSLNLRMPLEFPPLPMEHGKTTSGLSLPDIRGTWGAYFYLATDLSKWDLEDTEFGGRQVKLEFNQDTATAELDGPIDPRRDDFKRISIPLEVQLNEDNSAVTLNIQDQKETVQEGNWSDWFRFEFPIGPFVSVKGISRFFVLETFPEVRLYLMPISLSPEDPIMDISSPGEYVPQLVERIGLFKTLGWIHETWGLNEEQIDEDIFMEDLFRNMKTLSKVLLDELDRGDASLYTTVFTATDSVSHMFYRLIDPEHPRYDAELAAKHGDSILAVYKEMDSIVGEVQERLDENDILLIVSDHGFHSWRKEFNTNTWLVRNGFMRLKGMETDEDPRRIDQMFSGGSFFPNVDWSNTRAYSLGLGQIYVNLKGRESQGIVSEGQEYQQLIQEISSKILEFKDPDTGESVLQGAYPRDDIYSGDEVSHAGDILISFQSGYRTSWQTSLGAVPENIVVANLKKWSGDHCASDASDTAGFFVANRKVLESDPNIVDIAPTLYSLFGVGIPGEIDGKALTLQK